MLAEFFHLRAPSKRDHDSAWQLLRSGAITVISLDNADLPQLQSLMKRYRDRPMDFADATLVHAGSKPKLADIVTIDYDDFETYRMVGRFQNLRARFGDGLYNPVYHHGDNVPFERRVAHQLAHIYRHVLNAYMWAEESYE